MKKFPMKTKNKKQKTSKPKRKPRNKKNNTGQFPELLTDIQGLIEWLNRECETIRARMQPCDGKDKYKKALKAAGVLIKLQKIKKEIEDGGSESDRELKIIIKQYKEEKGNKCK